MSDLIEIAKRDKATAFFGDVYLLNGEEVDKARFVRESGLAHLLPDATIGVGVPQELRRSQSLNVERLYHHESWRIKGFAPCHSPILAPVRAWWYALLLRVVISRGYVVFLVGRCRSGKSYLIQHATPGRIISGEGAWQQPDGVFHFDVQKVANGTFSIDDVCCFDMHSLLHGVEALSGRHFILTAQRHEDIERSGVAELLQSSGRRILLVELE